MTTVGQTACGAVSYINPHAKETRGEEKRQAALLCLVKSLWGRAVGSRIFMVYERTREKVSGRAPYQRPGRFLEGNLEW